MNKFCIIEGNFHNLHYKISYYVKFFFVKKLTKFDDLFVIKLQIKRV